MTEETVFERVSKALRSETNRQGLTTEGYGGTLVDYDAMSRAVVEEMEKWRGEQLAKVAPFKTDLEAFINHSLPDRSVIK